jgi:hypothetical protein
MNIQAHLSFDSPQLPAPADSPPSGRMAGDSTTLEAWLLLAWRALPAPEVWQQIVQAGLAEGEIGF